MVSGVKTNQPMIGAKQADIEITSVPFNVLTQGHAKTNNSIGKPKKRGVTRDMIENLQKLF